jgi:hypothetical protein
VSVSTTWAAETFTIVDNERKEPKTPSTYAIIQTAKFHHLLLPSGSHLVDLVQGKTPPPLDIYSEKVKTSTDGICTWPISIKW